jgi:hypothetical protein
VLAKKLAPEGYREAVSFILPVYGNLAVLNKNQYIVVSRDAT